MTNTLKNECNCLCHSFAMHSEMLFVSLISFFINCIIVKNKKHKKPTESILWCLNIRKNPKNFYSHGKSDNVSRYMYVQHNFFFIFTFKSEKALQVLKKKEHFINLFFLFLQRGISIPRQHVWNAARRRRRRSCREVAAAWRRTIWPRSRQRYQVRYATCCCLIPALSTASKKMVTWRTSAESSFC